MRGSDDRSGSLFSYVDLEARVGADHPLRLIREVANAALSDLTGEFAALYPVRLGRPSIAPERLLRSMLLQAFYGIRSERQLMEQLREFKSIEAVSDPKRELIEKLWRSWCTSCRRRGRMDETLTVRLAKLWNR
jgi:hypothetical protein